MPTDFSSSNSAVAFLVAAGIVYEIIAKDCSSPQTTEINASTRADTLMKWVLIGVIESAVFIVIAVLYSPANKWPIIVGGTLAAAITYVEYVHAKQAGLASNAQPTEQIGF